VFDSAMTMPSQESLELGCDDIFDSAMTMLSQIVFYSAAMASFDLATTSQVGKCPTRPR